MALGFLIERVEKGDGDAALDLFRRASSPQSILELFEAASGVRDEALGRRLKFIGHPGDVSPCSVSPPCRFCSLSSYIKEYRSGRAPRPIGKIVEEVRYMLDRGVSVILFGGGISPASGRIAVELARLIRSSAGPDVELTFNVGPIGEEHVRELRAMGVRRFVISLETMDPELFRDARPGDSLESKLEFIEMLADSGIGVSPILMNGVGSEEDLVKSIVALGRLRNLAGLRLSTFSPVPGTPWEGRPQASALSTLRACAIARLLYPRAVIDLAAGTPDVMRPLSLLAGCGDEVVGIVSGSRGIDDRVDLISRYAQEMGFSVELRDGERR